MDTFNFRNHGARHDLWSLQNYVLQHPDAQGGRAFQDAILLGVNPYRAVCDRCYDDSEAPAAKCTCTPYCSCHETGVTLRGPPPIPAFTALFPELRPSKNYKSLPAYLGSEISSAYEFSAQSPNAATSRSAEPMGDSSAGSSCNEL